MNRPQKISASEIFFTFSLIGLMGFGGVMPWVYREVVEKKKWMSPQEFSDLLAMGQILPGGNVTNFSAMFGYRFAGFRGAFAGLAGLFSIPFVIVIIFGILCQRYGHLEMVQAALRGITAVVAGLVIVTGIKLARGQALNLRFFIFGVATLLGVGFLSWPLLMVVLVLAPLALLIERRFFR
jgi:chromate transporter